MTAHGIARDEWERRFAQRLKERAALDNSEIVVAELESWATGEEAWLTTTPEEAADENLLDWIPDE